LADEASSNENQAKAKTDRQPIGSLSDWLRQLSGWFRLSRDELS
jgi:hypothetical protein